MQLKAILSRSAVLERDLAIARGGVSVFLCPFVRHRLVARQN